MNLHYVSQHTGPLHSFLKHKPWLHRTITQANSNYKLLKYSNRPGRLWQPVTGVWMPDLWLSTQDAVWSIWPPAKRYIKHNCQHYGISRGDSGFTRIRFTLLNVGDVFSEWHECLTAPTWSRVYQSNDIIKKKIHLQFVIVSVSDFIYVSHRPKLEAMHSVEYRH